MNSLHTKYRPKRFEDVVGQSVVVKSLQRVVKDNRAKAFIFSGPAGTGKTTMARIMANTFAGGVGTAANIEEIAAADNTGVDDMRAVLARTLYRAVGQSQVKSFILDEAHRLSGNAWDVLLKPIEEPPAHCYWMICTTNPAKIPKTIQTRCLKFELKPVPESDLLGLLCRVCDAEGLNTPDDVLEAISEAAGGSPRQALTYLEACATAANANAARNIMQTAGKSREVIDLCRFLLAGRSHTWAEAMKFIQALEGTEAESIRIVVSNYIAAALLKTRDDSKAATLLQLLSCFAEPYNQSDKFAPLLNSVGLAIGLDK